MGPDRGVSGGGRKVYVEKVYVLFRSPSYRRFSESLLRRRPFPLQDCGLLSKKHIYSVQTRCIVEGEAQKSPLFWGFSGGSLIFSGSPVLQDFHKTAFKFDKIPDFYKHPL